MSFISFVRGGPKGNRRRPIGVFLCASPAVSCTFTLSGDAVYARPGWSTLSAELYGDVMVGKPVRNRTIAIAQWIRTLSGCYAIGLVYPHHTGQDG